MKLGWYDFPILLFVVLAVFVGVFFGVREGDPPLQKEAEFTCRDAGDGFKVCYHNRTGVCIAVLVHGGGAGLGTVPMTVCFPPNDGRPEGR